MLYNKLRRVAKGKMFCNLDKISTDLDILHAGLIICSAKFSLSSIEMPKYFTDLLTETGLLLKSNLIVGR